MNQFGWRTVNSTTVFDDPALDLLNTSPLRIDDYSQFIVPYERNVRFCGRSKLLQSIRTKLTVTEPYRWNHRLALHGLGGVGKTQLALEYAYRQKNDYRAVYWITAASPASLLSSFDNIAARASIPGSSTWSSVEHPHQFIRWLNRQDHWLFVIDNLDNIDIIHGYLPERSPTKHTLITTRNPFNEEILANGLCVDVFDRDEAVALLHCAPDSHLCRPRTWKLPRRSSQSSDTYPSLSSRPPRIFAKSSRDIHGFLPSYRRHRSQHLARVGHGNRQYGRSVATTWLLSIRAVADENTDAIELLQVLAFLCPEICVEFLEAGQEGLSSGLRETLRDYHRLHLALSVLARCSISMDGNSEPIHFGAPSRPTS